MRATTTGAVSSCAGCSVDSTGNASSECLRASGVRVRVCSFLSRSTMMSRAGRGCS